VTAAERLVRLGITAPRRAVRLIHEVKEQLALDLSGLVVVTEAGSGVYALTPVIAALAGAKKVRAITRDSAWGSAATVGEAVTAACELAGLSGRVELTSTRSSSTFSDADIVTNLGFVRPINAAVVELLKPTAVVPLMCEAWEARPGDVDLEACRRRKVLVLGTNEHHPLCNVFRYSGPLAGQLLFEAGFEVLGTRVLVVGGDRFAPVIVEWLARAGAEASQAHPADPRIYGKLAETDVLVVADYASETCVIGEGGMIDAARLGKAAPALTVVQFAGAIDVSALVRAGVRYWPDAPVAARRMVRTFSSLGAAPVIRLHAGGLKVAELGARARLDGLTIEAAETLASESGLAQPVIQPGAD
jgi:hypothetical protein